MGTLQTQTVLSSDEDASVVPLGDHETLVTQSVWCVRMRSYALRRRVKVSTTVIVDFRGTVTDPFHGAYAQTGLNK